MEIDVRWVGYGPESNEALVAAIARAKAGDPLAPVTVVVSSNQVGVATRRHLARCGPGALAGRGRGSAAVSFVTPYRLAEQLGASALAASGRRPVSIPVVAAALRAALADEPGIFATVAEHPATEAALVSTYRELREASADELDRLATAGRRARDVVRLHRAARSRLELDWYDEQDLMVAATATAGADAAPVGDAVGPVVLYLPQRLTPHAARFLRAVGSSNGLTVVAGATGDRRADQEVVDAVERLGGSRPPSVPSSAPVARRSSLPSSESPTNQEPLTRIVTTSDPDDEVRAAVRTVVDAARAGTPLDRIAVLYASAEPYARLAHDHFGAAGLAINGPSVAPLSSRIAGRVLLDGLALGRRDLRRDEVFAWLANGPIRYNGRPIPVERWERVSRQAGVVGGDDWQSHLDTFAAAQRDPESERARDATALAAFTTELRSWIAPDDGGVRSWHDHVDEALALLDRLLGPVEQWTGPAAAADPTVRRAERTAAERVQRAIRRLAVLDEVEQRAVPLDVFARTLAIELDDDLGRSGRFGDGVLVGPVGFALGLDLDLVIVMGMAEGMFPSTVRDDSLLPDDDRERVGPALPLRSARTERQHREFLAALAAGRRHVLSAPRGNLRRNVEHTPSRWLLDIASELQGERVWPSAFEAPNCDAPEPGVPVATTGAAESPAWLAHIPSFDAGLRHLTLPATAQEHRLRQLLATGGSVEAAQRLDDLVVRAGTETLLHRRSHDFTRHDGHVEGVELPSPTRRAVSTTRIEGWAVCPFAYFVQTVLGVEEVENPEEIDQISPLEKGNIIHGALETFIEDVLARPVDQRPRPHEPWTAADRAHLADIGGQLCDRAEAEGRTGRPIFWRRDRPRLLGDLQRFLDLDEQHRADAGASPVATELRFGFGDDGVPLPLTDGRSMRFRGYADRVDIDAAGNLHVIDYKSGSASRFKGLSPDDPDRGGTKLQLAVYAAAAMGAHGGADATVHSAYWFPKEIPKHQIIGYPVDDAVLQRVSATLTTIVDGIEHGVFIPHPTEGASSPRVPCAACDPDALGTTELRRAWERKRFAAEVAPYAELAEPLDDPAGDERAGVTS